jgi:hypothetical protein
LHIWRERRLDLAEVLALDRNAKWAPTVAVGRDRRHAKIIPHWLAPGVANAVTTSTPYVLALVFGLSFLLLTTAFRSIVVAAVSILLNLLSVGAA